MLPRPSKHKSHDTGHPSGAFTIVELLVVMAIIAVLLAIILPALGRARDQSKVVACQSRLRNIAALALMYAGEHEDRLPLDNRLGPGTPDDPNPHTPLIEALPGDIDEPEIYYCPSQTEEDLKYTRENFAAGTIGFFYYSYEKPPTNRRMHRIFFRDVKTPRRLRATMPGDTWVASDSWFPGEPTAHRWYKKGVSYARLDTSVAMLHKSPRREFK